MKSVRTPMEKFEVLIIKKFHWIVGIVMTIVTPTVSVTAAYYKGREQINEKIATVKEEMVPKSEFNLVVTELRGLTKEVARMSGAMEEMNRQRGGRR